MARGGRPSRARRLLEQALVAATGGGEPYPRATADLHVGLAELDRERGDLAAAESHLDTARVLAERSSIPENRHRWYVAMAQVRATAGDHDAAAGLLDQAQRLYRPGFYPDVRPLAAMRARLDLLRGDVDAAVRWAREVGVPADDEITYLREYEHLTAVRLLLAHHRAGQAGAADGALALLDRLRAAVHPSRGGSLLEIGLLTALAHHARGDGRRALAELGHALTRAPEPDSYTRLFLDEGDSLPALLRMAGTVAGTAEEAAVRRLANRLGGVPVARSTGLVDPLSDRELEVLRLLDSELTGPEIARRLFVSVNTLRTHTRHIFAKLQVTNRSAAVRRGHRLGLL